MAKALERKEPDFSRLGQTVSASMTRGLKVPSFDVRVVARFPVPLDKDGTRRFGLKTVRLAVEDIESQNRDQKERVRCNTELFTDKLLMLNSSTSGAHITDGVYMCRYMTRTFLFHQLMLYSPTCHRSSY